MAGLPPPPINDAPGSFTWLEWYRQLRNYVSTSGSVPWYIINFAGSNITDIALRDHANLQSVQGGASGEQYHLTLEDYSNLLGPITTFDTLKVNNNLVMPKTPGVGIKVDEDAPTFGWRDLLGEVSPKSSGAGSPTLSTFRGGRVRAYAFNTGDEYDCSFHIPHDWVPGTDLHLHTHWAHNGTAISGNLVLTWSLTYAKGHQQANFPAEITHTQTISAPNIATIPQYQHNISEVQITSAGGSASTLNTNDIEVDGLMLIHLDATTIPTITGGSPNRPFILFVDLHYQSTNMPTKNKAPNFYA